MVSCCSAVGCRMRAEKGVKVTFHRFPSRPEALEKWLKALKRKNFTPTKNSRLCAKHFTPDSYNFFHGGRKILKEDAVPSIFDFSEFVSESNRYKPGNPEISRLVPDTSKVDKSGSINCIQFVDVDSLKCTSIPYTSNQTVIIIETSNQVGPPDTSEEPIETDSQDLEVITTMDPISSTNNKIISTTSNVSYSAPQVQSVDSINAPSTSSNTSNSSQLQAAAPCTSSNTSNSSQLHAAAPSTSSNTSNSSQLQAAAFRNLSAETYSSRNSPHDWRRQQFIIKAKEMKSKYRERLKIMNHVNQQLRKRKAFLENLLIRIKEKQLTSYDDDVDLVDCFVEEDSWESDEESSDDMNTDVEDKIFSMIDEKITKAGTLGQIDESKKDECETFGVYVESMLNVMSEKDAIAAKNKIMERINVHKGKRLITMSKKFDDAFSGLENIEID